MESLSCFKMAQLLNGWKKWQPPTEVLQLSLMDRLFIFLSFTLNDSVKVQACRRLLGLLSAPLFGMDELNILQHCNAEIRNQVVKGLYKAINMLTEEENSHTSVAVLVLILFLSNNKSMIVSSWTQKMLSRLHILHAVEQTSLLTTIEYLISQGDVEVIQGVCDGIISLLASIELSESIRAELVVRLCTMVCENPSTSSYHNLKSIMQQVKRTTLSTTSADSGISQSKPHTLSVCFQLVRTISFCLFSSPLKRNDIFPSTSFSFEWIEMVFLSLSSHDQKSIMADLRKFRGKHNLLVMNRFDESISAFLGKCFDMIVSQDYIASKFSSSFSCFKRDTTLGFEQVVLCFRHLTSDDALVWKITSLSNQMVDSLGENFVADCELVLEMYRQRAMSSSSSIHYYSKNCFVVNIQVEGDFDISNEEYCPMTIVNDMEMHWQWPCSLEDAILGATSFGLGLSTRDILKLCWERFFLVHFFFFHISTIPSVLVFAEMAKILCQVHMCRLLLREVVTRLTGSKCDTDHPQFVEMCLAQCSFIQTSLETILKDSISKEMFRKALDLVGVLKIVDNYQQSQASPLYFTSVMSVFIMHVAELDMLVNWTEEEINSIAYILNFLMNEVSRNRFRTDSKSSSSSFSRELKPLFDLESLDKNTPIGHPLIESARDDSEKFCIENKIILGKVVKVGAHKLALIVSFIALKALAKIGDHLVLKALTKVFRIQCTSNQSSDRISIISYLQQALLDQRDFVVTMFGSYLVDYLSIDSNNEESACSNFYWKLLHMVFPEFLELPLCGKVQMKGKIHTEFPSTVDPICSLILNSLLEPVNNAFVETTIESWNPIVFEKESLTLQTELVKISVTTTYDCDQKYGTLTNLSQDKFILLHLLKLWWHAADTVVRFKGMITIVQDFFCGIIHTVSPDMSSKKARTGHLTERSLPSIPTISQFPHAGVHCTELLITFILSLLPTCLSSCSLQFNANNRGSSDEEYSLYHIFHLTCMLIMWIYARLSCTICDQQNSSFVDLIASLANLLAKVSKAVGGALTEKLLHMVRNRIEGELSSDPFILKRKSRSDDDLGEAFHWALAVMETMKRFQEIYVYIFAMQDGMRNRWEQVADVIYSTVTVIKKLIELYHIEEDPAYVSKLYHSCCVSYIPEPLNDFKL